MGERREDGALFLGRIRRMKTERLTAEMVKRARDAGLRSEFARQERECADTPDCVQRSASGFGKRLTCRCEYLKQRLKDLGLT